MSRLNHVAFQRRGSGYEQVAGNHELHDPDLCWYCESDRYDQTECDDCAGSGGTVERPCESCEGHGFWGHSW